MVTQKNFSFLLLSFVCFLMNLSSIMCHSLTYSPLENPSKDSGRKLQEFNISNMQSEMTSEESISQIMGFIKCLDEKVFDNKLKTKVIDFDGSDPNGESAWILLEIMEKMKNSYCQEMFPLEINGNKAISGLFAALEKYILDERPSSGKLRFLEGKKDAEKNGSVKNEEKHPEQKPPHPRQSNLSTIMVIIAFLFTVPLVVVGVLKFIKKKKGEGVNKHTKMEKLKFLPRMAIPSEAIFGEVQTGATPKAQTRESVRKTRGANYVLKLEENHQSSVINEHIFTNINEDSLYSLENDSPRSTVRDTPQSINFNIEFSMLEQKN